MKSYFHGAFFSDKIPLSIKLFFSLSNKKKSIRWG